MKDEQFEAAFEDLFPKAFGLAHRILGVRAMAEDVAAEALARTFASWKRLRNEPYLQAWVLRVTTNLALDVVKRRKPSTRPVESVNPEETAALRSALQEALRSLPRRQREIITLRHLAGMTEAETADVLGISVGSVKTHAHRASAALKRKLGYEYGPGSGMLDQGV